MLDIEKSKEELLLELKDLKLENEILKVRSQNNDNEKNPRVLSLNDSNSLFQNLVYYHDSIMLLIEPESGKIINANLASSRFYGYSIQTLCSMTMDQINTMPAEQLEILMKIAMDEKKNYFIFNHKLASGELRQVEVHSSPIEYEGNKLLFSIIHDISDKKKNEDLIKDKENRIRAVFDLSFEFIALLSTDGILLEVNRTALEFAKIRSEDVLGKPFWDTPWWYHSTELQERLKDIIRKSALGETFRFEVTHPSIDGTLHIIDFSLKPVRNEDGKIYLLIPEGRDITEKKIADEELRISEERYKNIFNNSQIGIFRSNREGKILMANPKLINMLGYSSLEDLMDTNLEKKIYKEPDLRIKYIEEIDLNGFMNNYEVIWNKKDGSEICVNLNSHVIRDNIGNVHYYESTVEDITNRKKSEKALKESESRYQKLFTMMRLMSDTMPDMVWAKDLNYQFIFTNKAFCTNLLNAKDTEEPIGKTDIYFAKRERESHPDDPNWHTFGELCSDSDKITLKEMKEMQYDEYGNIKGKFHYLDVRKAPLINQNGELIGVVGTGRDITDRKNAENEISKLTKAVEHSPASIVITDTNGNIEYVNKKFCEVTGYTIEEVMEKNPRILKSSKTPEFIHKNLWDTINEGLVWHGEFVNLKKNREEYIEKAIISPIKNENGKIINFMAIKEDITELKRAEKIIREKNELQQILINNLPALIYFKDSNLKYQLVNESYANVLKLSFSEIIGKSDFELNQPEIYEKIDKDLIQSKKSQYDFEIQHTDAKGNIFWTSTSKVIYRDEHENVLGIIGIVQDITERKRAVEELKKSEERYRSLFENTGTSSIIIEEDATISLANEEFLRRTGYTKTELEGVKKWTEIVYEEDVEWMLKQHKLRRINPEFTTPSYEFRYKTIHGDMRYALINVQLVPGTNKSIASLMDITESKLAEDELKLLYEEIKISNDIIQESLYQKNRLVEELSESEEKLKETVAIKDKFFSIIAHDLRGPFTGFLGLTDLMAEGADKLSIDNIKKMSVSINKSAKSVYNLIEDLFLWSRTQTGSMTFQPEKLDLHEISSNIIYSLNQMAVDKKIELIQKIPPSTYVTGDRNMLSTVFRNLISNALKFTYENGAIEIGKINSSDDFIEIYIRDNGIGIPENIIEKLFKAGEYFTSAGTKNEKGTGLGLILCKEFVEKHEGKIRVESEEGNGSTFYFSLQI